MATGRATAIYLIENDGRIRPIDLSADPYESGYWVVSDDVAAELKGGDIYFRSAQTAPSYFGGTILDHRRETDGEYAARLIFRFRASPSHRGLRAGAGDWGSEKKIIRSDER